MPGHPGLRGTKMKRARDKDGNVVPRKMPRYVTPKEARRTGETPSKRYAAMAGPGEVKNPEGKAHRHLSFTELAKRILNEPISGDDPNAVIKLEYLVRTVINKAMEGDRCCLVELLSRIDPPPKGDREERATKVVVNMITEGSVALIRQGLQESREAVVTPNLLEELPAILENEAVSL